MQKTHPACYVATARSQMCASARTDAPAAKKVEMMGVYGGFSFLVGVGG